MAKPVITAVNGICAGGGFHWVADADIVIAASDAQFFDPHVSVGQVVSIEAIGLIRKMPFEAVMRMALVGRYERMSAQRAYELGMISQIVDPPEKLRDVAQELAETIARNSPAAMAATKRALWGALEAGLTDACKAGAEELVSMWGHPDQEEGPGRSPRSASPAGSNPSPRPTEVCPDPPASKYPSIFPGEPTRSVGNRREWGEPGQRRPSVRRSSGTQFGLRRSLNANQPSVISSPPARLASMVIRS